MPREEQIDVQPTLLFIPDISGFTKFVKANAIQHARHIIEELLEVLIDANDMDLKISEIEGDAILFYRQGPKPTAAELLAQVQRMYVQFHAHLKRYEAFRICQCGACCTANKLALKFILHFGDLATKHVKEYAKLFGNELIVAHRLMKNDIPLNQYVLLTHQLINACSAWVELKQVSWDEFHEGEGTYDEETVKYCYLSLDALAAHVPEPKIEDYSVKGAETIGLQLEALIHAPLEMVFSIISDVASKHLWVDGVKSSAEQNGNIAKNGITHRCVMSGTDQDPFFISHDFNVGKDVVTWVDSDHKAKMNLVIRLERKEENLTRVIYTFLIPSNLLARLMFRFKAKKMLSGWMTGNFKNLDEYCQQLISEGKEHHAQIEIGEVVSAE